MGMPVTDFASAAVAQAAGSLAAIKEVAVPQTVNLARYSEELSWAYYITGATAAKTGASLMAAYGSEFVKLDGVTTANPYASLCPNFGSAAIALFVTGKKYLVSLYIYSSTDFWFVPRVCPGASDPGQGAILCRGGRVTRVWYTGMATSPYLLDIGTTPASAWGAGTGTNPVLVTQNNNGACSLFAGGMQIEGLPSLYRDGIAMIGDSRLAGASGGGDRNYDFKNPNNAEISTHLGSMLKVNVFNRGLGGNKLSDMDARWATDITPLVSRCRDVVIQGGINNFGNGLTGAAALASVASMTAKAAADGFAGVKYLTCEPGSTTSANAAYEAERKAYNAGLISTYGLAENGGKVCDIAALLTDDTGKDLIGSAYGDGIHYPGPAKQAVAAKMAAELDWTWRRTPGAYVKVAA